MLYNTFCEYFVTKKFAQIVLKYYLCKRNQTTNDYNKQRGAYSPGRELTPTKMLDTCSLVRRLQISSSLTY